MSVILHPPSRDCRLHPSTTDRPCLHLSTKMSHLRMHLCITISLPGAGEDLSLPSLCLFNLPSSMLADLLPSQYMELVQVLNNCLVSDGQPGILLTCPIFGCSHLHSYLVHEIGAFSVDDCTTIGPSGNILEFGINRGKAEGGGR